MEEIYVGGNGPLTVDEILLNIGQRRCGGGSLLEVSAGERLCVQMLGVPEGGDRQAIETYRW